MKLSKVKPIVWILMGVGLFLLLFSAWHSSREGLDAPPQVPSIPTELGVPWIGGSWHTNGCTHVASKRQAYLTAKCGNVETKLLAKNCPHYNAKWQPVSMAEPIFLINAIRGPNDVLQCN